MGNRFKKRLSGKRLVYRIIVNIFLIIFLQMTLFCTFGIGMIYYGPFTNIKEMLVTSAMTTLSHQYVATWFLSSKEINKIMDKNKIDDSEKKSDISAIAVYNDNAVKEKKDDKDKIEYIDISNDKIKGHVLIIKDPRRVSVATSDKIGKVGMQLTDIVKTNNAIGGINAGGFSDENGQGNGGTPQGLVIENGKVVFGKDGVKYPIIGFNEDSVLVLGRYTLKEVMEKKIRDAVTFEPFLVVNGEPTIKSGNGGWGLAPRTVIGQTKDGAVIFLVIDGRQLDSIGATLKDVQDIMLSYGAYNAANLDGGSSTTMVYNGKIENSPSSKYGPRYLPSAFIIK